MMHPGFAKPRSLLPWLPYPESDTVRIINSHFGPPPNALKTSLISYWKLDESSGNAVDAHGTNTLTAFNSPGSAAGKVGNCRDLESSSSQYFSRSSNAELQTGDIDFTVQAWVNAESLGTNVIVGKWSVSGSEWLLFSIGGSTLAFYVKSGVGSVTKSFSTVGSWALIHAWHDAANNQLGLSVNAGTPTTASYSGGITTGTSTFDIGRSGDGGNHWDGLLDEIGFWKRILTGDERTLLYNSGNGYSYGDFQ